MNVRSLLLAAALLAPASAVAGEFDAYRIPEHTWRSGSAALAGRYSRNSYTTDSPYSSAAKQSNGAGALEVSFARGYDSDRFQRSWRASARGTISGENVEEQRASLARTVDSWSRRGGGVFEVLGNFRAYPEERKVGLDLSGAFVAITDQGLLRRDDALSYPDTRYENRTDYQQNRYDYAGNATVTLGHGLVRDATVVEDVHVLEQRLLVCGTLSRALSPGAREKLAALLTVTPSLAYEHDRPDRYAWREVERVLREDGALAGESLDAYGLLRAMEPYLSVPSQRRTGHFAGLAAMFEHRHEIDRGASQTTSRTYLGDSLVAEAVNHDDARQDGYGDRAYVGVAAEWHRPSGWRVQWDAAGRALVPARAGEHGLTEQVDLTAEWHVADRWQVTGGVRQERDYLEQGERDDSTPHDSWRTTLAGQLDYYVEDNLSVRLTVSDSQSSRREKPYGDGATYDNYAHDGSVQLGISYRFLGRVSAPGLFERMTPLE
jgi:hypothetical protein